MNTTTTKLGATVHLTADFSTALDRVVAALKTEGFGVLTEIDVQDTLKKKLNVDFRRYRILGACNPTLAHRALEAAPEVGLLLPCNVVVSAVDDQHTDVSIVDPLAMLGFVGHPALKPIAEEAGARLNRVATALQTVPLPA